MRVWCSNHNGNGLCEGWKVRKRVELGLRYSNFPHDASFAIVPLERKRALSSKSKYRYMPGPLSHQLELNYQLFFNDEPEDNSHHCSCWYCYVTENDCSIYWEDRYCNWARDSGWLAIDGKLALILIFWGMLLLHKYQLVLRMVVGDGWRAGRWMGLHLKACLLWHLDSGLW